MRKYAILYGLTFGLFASGAAVRASDCGPHAKAPCCDQHKKVCIRVDDKKKVTKPHYSCKEEEICTSGCSLCGLFSKKSCDGCQQGCNGCQQGCNGCEQGCDDKCGKVRTRRKLVKKMVTEEKCGTKCIPVIKECSAHCNPCGTVLVETKPAEKLPTKPMPDKK